MTRVAQISMSCLVVSSTSVDSLSRFKGSKLTERTSSGPSEVGGVNGPMKSSGGDVLLSGSLEAMPKCLATKFFKIFFRTFPAGVIGYLSMPSSSKVVTAAKA